MINLMWKLVDFIICLLVLVSSVMVLGFMLVLAKHCWEQL